MEIVSCGRVPTNKMEKREPHAELPESPRQMGLVGDCQRVFARASSLRYCAQVRRQREKRGVSTYARKNWRSNEIMRAQRGKAKGKGAASMQQAQSPLEGKNKKKVASMHCPWWKTSRTRKYTDPWVEGPQKKKKKEAHGQRTY